MGSPTQPVCSFWLGEGCSTDHFPDVWGLPHGSHWGFSKHLSKLRFFEKHGLRLRALTGPGLVDETPVVCMACICRLTALRAKPQLCAMSELLHSDPQKI